MTHKSPPDAGAGDFPESSVYYEAQQRAVIGRQLRTHWSGAIKVLKSGAVI